jgi:hypothetical protein
VAEEMTAKMMKRSDWATEEINYLFACALSVKCESDCHTDCSKIMMEIKNLKAAEADSDDEIRNTDMKVSS